MNFIKKKLKKLQQKYFDILYDKCKEMNLILTQKENIKFDSNKDWASVTIYNDIKSHQENQELVPPDFWESFDGFSKKYCGNKEHVLYIDKTKDYPSIEEAIKAIKNAGGLVFLPHIYIYKWAYNIENLLEDLLKKYEMNGIECYHSEFTNENIEHLKQFCSDRGYFMSGGSDYHGINKKNIEMAVGKGNLKIEKSIIKEWV